MVSIFFFRTLRKAQSPKQWYEKRKTSPKRNEKNQGYEERSFTGKKSNAESIFIATLQSL
jgi:hypothetical protein